jgi:two-component system, NtrC family, response regulator AtoC
MARVLVVDDDTAGLDLRKMILEREGHQVTTAADPEQARAAFADTAPEIVILDLRLPKAEDGLALIREFRASAAEVRIVVLCGWSGDLDGRPERAMVGQVLLKPVRSEAIIGACFR